MKGLKTLVMMQLKDKVDFSFTKSVKKTIFKVVLTLLKFVLVTALIFAGFYVVSFLRLVSLLPGIPQNFFTIIFTLMYILSMIVCIFGMMKDFYFAKDNQVLLTMPVRRETVFISKLVVYYIYEFIRNLTYLLPLFVAYGMINKLPFYFYIWLIPMIFILTLLPVAVGALLSIPMLFIVSLVKQNKWLEYVLVVLAIAGVVTVLALAINAIPSNFDLIGTWGTTFWQIQDFMTSFAKIFAPFVYVVIAVTGSSYGITTTMFGATQWFCILGVLAVCLVSLGFTYLLARPLFFKMTSSPFEYRKKKTNAKQNKVAGGFVSGVKKEIVLSYRSGSKFYSLVVSVFGMPLTILLLNKLFSAMDTRLSGVYMGYAFNILLIMIMALSSSINIAHALSEEGASSYLLKTNPKSYLELVTSKFFFQAVCMTGSILATVIIFASFVNLGWLDTILVFLVVEMFYIAHLFMSAEMDVVNPQTQQYQTTGTHPRDPNDIKSFLYSYLIAALVAFGAFFLVQENAHTVWPKLLFIAAAFLALRTYLFVSKVKVYFKERQ